MRRLDNRGFAITGILYTLFTLFILILFSILSGLQVKKQMLEKNTEKLEESYKGKDVTENNKIGISKAQNAQKALVKGKYVFQLSNDSKKIQCYTYLNKDDPLTVNDITFVPSDCNDYKGDTNIEFNLLNIYSFESE